VTRAEVESIIGAIIPRYKVLVVLLAGTGLRIGEALGVKATDLGPECRVLHVRRSVWDCQEQLPKTSNAVRVVDVPEQLAKVLPEYAVETYFALYTPQVQRAGSTPSGDLVRSHADLLHFYE